MTSIRSYFHRLKDSGALALVAGFVFAAIVFSKLVSMTTAPPADTNSQPMESASSTFHNADIFTSMEGQFEWNRFMVPGFEPKTIDSGLSIEPRHDSGRRLPDQAVNGHMLRYEFPRGLRNGD